MQQELVRYKVEQGTATITLNRPDVLNSFNQSMALQLQDILKQVEKDPGIRAVLLTGEGRAFCAGQDLSEIVDGKGHLTADVQVIVRDHFNPIIRSIRHMEKPFVCAVNGVAAGAGANIALACDLVLASEKASFIQAFSKIGLIPDSGGTFFLPRLIGLARATSAMLLGETIRARQAFEMQMIYRVCPSESLLAEAAELAVSLASQPTRALGLIKRAINRSLAVDLDAQLLLEEELQGIAGRTSDFQEGVQAFLNKREPRFTGK